MPAVKKPFLFALWFGLLAVTWVLPAIAAPLPQSGDPADACASGVELYMNGQMKEALPLLEAGISSGNKANFDSIDDLGYCAFLLGVLRRDIDDRSGALEAFTIALQAFQESENRHYEAETLNRIGLVNRERSRFSDALNAYQQALGLARELDDPRIIGRVLNNMGAVYNQLGDFDEALKYYEEALKFRRSSEDRGGEGFTLNNIGEVHRNQARYADALEHYQAALGIYRNIPDWDGVGRTLNNIGLVYDAQGRHAEAQIQYQEALEIFRDTENLREEGNTLGNIGLSFTGQGDYIQALEYFQESLKIMEAVEDRFGEGITLSNMGEAYRSLGEYDKAMEAYQEGLEIAQEVGDRVGEGTVLNNIGMIYINRDQLPEALEVFRQSLDIRREVGDRIGEGITLYNMGTVYEELGDEKRALDDYEQAIVVFESLRATSGSERGRASFIAQYAGSFSRAVALYSQTGQAQEAFFTSERARARTFLDSLSTGQVQLADDEAAGLLEAEQKAYKARQNAREALDQAKEQDPNNQEVIAKLEGELKAAEQTHQQALQAIEARDDQLAALVPGRSTVLAVQEVQALLDDQTSLISYYLLEEGGSLAFIVTRDRLTMVELPEATPETLQAAVADLHKWINKENQHPLPLQNLYKWLVAPVLGQIHTPRIGIIPHQQMHYIPFAALSDGQTYLGEGYLLFTLPSASAYHFIQQNAQTASQKEGRPALVFGNPAVSEPGFSPLLYAEGEAEQVASLLQVPPFIGEQASEARFWTEANMAEVIHLAAHGTYDQTNPLFSAIHLAKAGDYDGLLQAQEIYSLDLSVTDFVVLSACETSIGELSAGDEVVGLTRAFFFAGSPSILSSLWKVDDAATAALMESYYRHWLDGKSKAEALQAAQAEVREQYPSPYFWAAFVLNGDPGISSAVVETETVSTDETATNETAPAEDKPDSGGWLCSSAGLILLFGISIGFAKSHKRGRSADWEHGEPI